MFILPPNFKKFNKKTYRKKTSDPGLRHLTLHIPMAYCMLFQPSSPFAQRCKLHSNPAVGSQHHHYRPKSSHSLPLHTSQLQTKWQFVHLSTAVFFLVAKNVSKIFLVPPGFFLIGNCAWSPRKSWWKSPAIGDQVNRIPHVYRPFFPPPTFDQVYFFFCLNEMSLFAAGSWIYLLVYVFSTCFIQFFKIEILWSVSI